MGPGESCSIDNAWQVAERKSNRFLYDFVRKTVCRLWLLLIEFGIQVTFPNGVFSGTIISSVIKDGDIKQTAEWQLLLGAIALPGT